METIKIKYFDKDLPHLEKIAKGDWIDLRASETVEMRKGDFKLIPLGIAMELPKGYEANIVPRSSLYKNFKILQTNSYAVIDSTYCGNDDMWRYPVLAMEDTIIQKGDRICQFRINKIQPEIEFIEVEELKASDRNGFGSTGSK